MNHSLVTAPIVLVLAVACLLITPPIAPGQDHAPADLVVTWDPTVQITSDSVGDDSPQVFVAGDTVHILWFGTGGIDGGVEYARSTDAGSSFGPPTTLIVNGAAGNWVTPQGYSFAASGLDLYYSATSFVLDSALNFHNSFDLAGSTDGGVSWSPLATVASCPGACMTRTFGLAAHGASLYQVVTQFYEPPDSIPFALIGSTDRGSTWHAPALVPSGDHLSRIGANGYGFHYVGAFPTDTTEELFYQRTADMGETWEEGAILTDSGDGYQDDPSLAVTEDGLLYAVWHSVPYEAPDEERERVRLRRSPDNGATWDGAISVHSSHGVEFPVVAGEGPVVAVTWSNYGSDTGDPAQVLKVSTDHGSTWSELLPMEGVNVYSLNVDGNTLHAAWWEHGEVYYKQGTIETITAAGDEPGPSAFRLGQNYPNPFNGSTTISFALPDRAPVSLRIYDILGRLVATLAEGIRSAGEHHVRWDAGDLPAGMYCYRLQAGTGLETRKLLFLK